MDQSAENSFPYRCKNVSRTSLPVAEWPAGDREAWQRALVGGEFLERSGGGAHWAAETRYRTERAYGRLLRWLQLCGELDPAASIGSRLEQGTIGAFVAEMIEINAAQTVIGRLQGLERFARVTVPEGDWSFLGRLQRKLQPRVKDCRQKALRLRPTDELVRLGKGLMEEAEGRGQAMGLRRAGKFRDGLMICLMALRPVRLGNFTAITIDRHLVKRSGRWWLWFDRTETKQRREISEAIPLSLVPFLERYLDQIRPLLIAAGKGRHDDGGRLWLGWHGRPMTARHIHVRIKLRTRRGCGRSIYPHLFRDAAGMTVALERPEHVAIVQKILEHGSFQATENYLRVSRAVQATLAHESILEEIRSNPAEK